MRDTPFLFSSPRFDLAWWWVRCVAVGATRRWVGEPVTCGNGWPVGSVRVLCAVGVCRVRTWGNMPGASCDRRSRDCRGETRPAACGVSEPCVSLRGLRGLPRGVQAWVVLSHILGILLPACLSSSLLPVCRSEEGSAANRLHGRGVCTGHELPHGR